MANEKRLIDANKVIDAMQKCLDENPHTKDTITYRSFESIIECLKQAPTVDAVEVVRCKDCKHRGDDVYCPMCFEECIEYEDDGYSEYDYLVHDHTTDDGFCDRGERREGE